jgi:chromosome segregation ATPase
MIQLMSKSSNDADAAYYADAQPAAPSPGSEPADGFAMVANKIAVSLTECWSGALSEVDRRAALDRGQLQDVLKTLASLSEKVQSISERQELADRNYHDLATRLFRVEERTETQGAAVASLEQTVAGQVGLIENRIVPTLTGLSEGVATLTQALEAQGAAQKSMLERLERQAQAIQSVHGVLESQAQRWNALKQAAEEFVQRLDVPAGSPLAPENL